MIIYFVIIGHANNVQCSRQNEVSFCKNCTQVVADHVADPL